MEKKYMLFDKTELMTLLEEMRTSCKKDETDFDCFRRVLLIGELNYLKELEAGGRTFFLKKHLIQNKELITNVIKSYNKLQEGNNAKFYETFKNMQTAKSRVNVMNKRIQELVAYRNGICKMRRLSPFGVFLPSLVFIVQN